MKVYFSHGKESGPWGSKITRLAALAKAQGCAVESIDYRGIDDPDQRAALLIDILKNEHGKVLLVGSSMGGYAALVAGQLLAEQKIAQAKATSEPLEIAGIFILAPALYMPGYQVQEYTIHNTPIAVVHGWADEIIPAAQAIRFAQDQNCSLHLIPGDHRLNSSMHIVEPLFSQFMRSLIHTGR
ncbi:alpha/beta hydrolase [Oceanisphaera sp. W20_SRM_FM3]|uniref:alpha/beta hydrolase n=1 Tax=Oceanisphaera sp. W20_SRM_FM3 TaxID=3240267 RepID=UPI003F9ACB9B